MRGKILEHLQGAGNLDPGRWETGPHEKMDTKEFRQDDEELDGNIFRHKGNTKRLFLLQKEKQKIMEESHLDGSLMFDSELDSTQSEKSILEIQLSREKNQEIQLTGGVQMKQKHHRLERRG